MSREIAVSTHSRTYTEGSSMSIYKQPYTYLIGWTIHNKWYYGVRFAKNCNPSDLWNTYFTSSKSVHNFRNQYGEPDIIQIRKIFDNENSARLWETKVLKRMNVINTDKWLNQTNNIAISSSVWSGKKRSEADKSKRRNRKRPDQSIFMKEKWKNGEYFNVKFRKDKRPEHGKIMKEKWKNDEYKQKIIKRGSEHHLYGIGRSEITKRKISETVKSKRMKVVCCIKCHKNNILEEGLWLCHYNNHHKDCIP